MLRLLSEDTDRLNERKDKSKNQGNLLMQSLKVPKSFSKSSNNGDSLLYSK